MRSRGRQGPARLVCLDKPAGPTSFDLVREVRRVTGYRKVGHGGTLDPFATGLLVLGLGSATRLMGYVGAGSKEYELSLHFGIGTDSHDITGVELARGEPGFDEGALRRALPEFVGEIQQIPPSLSAVKVDGQRAYRRHRSGETLDPLPARTVRIDRIVLEAFELPAVRLRVECGGGTYMRSLARDLGERLGCPCHASALRRVRAGAFDVREAVDLEALRATWPEGPGVLRPVELVREWPGLALSAEDVVTVRQGLQPPDRWWGEAGWETVPERAALLDPEGELVALARAEEGHLRLAVVLPKEDDADLSG